MDLQIINNAREKYFCFSEKENQKIIEEYKNKEFRKMLNKEFKGFMGLIVKDYKLSKEEEKKLTNQIKWEWEELFVNRILNDNVNFIQLKNMKYLPYWFEEKIRERKQKLSIAIRLMYRRKHPLSKTRMNDIQDIINKKYNEQQELKVKTINEFLK